MTVISIIFMQIESLYSRERLQSRGPNSEQHRVKHQRVTEGKSYSENILQVFYFVVVSNGQAELDDSNCYI